MDRLHFDDLHVQKRRLERAAECSYLILLLTQTSVAWPVNETVGPIRLLDHVRRSLGSKRVHRSFAFVVRLQLDGKHRELVFDLAAGRLVLVPEL